MEREYAKSKSKTIESQKGTRCTKTQLAYITTKTSNAQKTRKIEMNKVIDARNRFLNTEQFDDREVLLTYGALRDTVENTMIETLIMVLNEGDDKWLEFGEEIKKLYKEQYHETLEDLEQEYNQSEMACFKSFYDAGDTKLLLGATKRLNDGYERYMEIMNGD